MESVTDFIFLGSRITVDSDCSHEIKRHLFFRRKATTNRNMCYGFSSSHVLCESWTIKRAEQRRIDAFTLWCWRRLLRVLGQQRDKILKEISPEWKD